MSGSMDVVVVGAGFAGLIAARDLAQRGRRVLTLETRPDRRPGVLRTVPAAGCVVELGGVWFDGHWQTPLRADVERYGVAIADATPYQSTRWFTGGELRQALPVPRWEGGEMERTLFEFTAAARDLNASSPEALRALEVPLSAWLDRLDSQPAGRDFIYGWASLVTGAHPDDVPALRLIGMIAHHGGVYAFYADLKHLFADRTASQGQAIAVDAPGQIRLKAPVRAVHQDDLGVRVETDSGPVAATACVLAVPVNMMSDITFEPALEPERSQALAQGHNCTMAKFMIGC